MKRFAWKDSYRRASLVDPNQAGEFLENLSDRYGSFLKTVHVVDAARPEDSPIHHGFEWDDSRAAEGFRQVQAREMLRNIRVLVGTEEVEPHRVFLNVIQEGEGQGYATTAKILSDEDLHEQVIQTAKAQLEGWAKRYKEIKELGSIVELIEEFLQPVA